MSDIPKTAPTRTIRGVDLWETWLSAEHQIQMLADIRRIVSQAPLFEPITPAGKKMSVRMTAACRYGWVTDKKGLPLSAKPSNRYEMAPYSPICFKRLAYSVRHEPQPRLLFG